MLLIIVSDSQYIYHPRWILVPVLSVARRQKSWYDSVIVFRDDIVSDG